MCYTVPIAAAIVTTFMWKKNKSLKLWYLLLLFLGGSLFGVIDHLWNKELFLISENWVKDLALGVVITTGITLAWGLMLFLAKKHPALIPSPGALDTQ
jgi:hypothetical protein